MSRKKKSWENLDEIFQKLLTMQKIIFMKGDLDGHVGRESGSFEKVHSTFGYDDRSDLGIFFFYDLLFVNILYRKGKEHLITFKNISNWSKLTFSLKN